jgi:hypothetical protein
VFSTSSSEDSRFAGSLQPNFQAPPRLAEPRLAYSGKVDDFMRRSSKLKLHLPRYAKTYLVNVARFFRVVAPIP